MVKRRLVAKPSGIVPIPFSRVAGIKAITRLAMSCKRAILASTKDLARKYSVRETPTVKLFLYSLPIRSTPRTKHTRIIQRKTRFEPLLDALIRASIPFQPWVGVSGGVVFTDIKCPVAPIVAPSNISTKRMNSVIQNPLERKRR